MKDHLKRLIVVTVIVILVFTSVSDITFASPNEQETVPNNNSTALSLVGTEPLVTPEEQPAESSKNEANHDTTPVTLLLDTVVVSHVIEKESKQVHLQQLYSDGSKEDVTNEAIWTSEDTSIAQVSKGNVTGVTTGDTVIHVTYEDQAMLSFFINVTEAQDSYDIERVTLSQSSINEEVGAAPVSVTAYSTNKYGGEDVTTLGTWESDNTDVATVSSDGVIELVGLGSANVYFRYKSYVGNVWVQVIEPADLYTSTPDIELMPSDSNLVFVRQVFNNGTERDVTDYADWSSADPSIADVRYGIISGFSVGTTTVTASYRSRTVTYNVTVTNKPYTPVVVGITSTPSKISLDTRETANVSISAIYSDGKIEDVSHEVEWVMADPVVAYAEDAKITAGAAGTTLVEAHYDNRYIAVPVTVAPYNDEYHPPIFTSLSVTPKVNSMSIGSTEQLKVEAISGFGQDPSKNVDLTDAAIYKSLNSDVVTVSNTGELHAIKPGTARITITAFGFTERLTIEVPEGTIMLPDGYKKITALEPSETNIHLDRSAYSVKVNAKYRGGSSADVTKKSSWTSLDSSIVKVAGGVLTPVSPGATKILVHDGEASTLIDVSVGIPDETSAKTVKGLLMTTQDVVVQQEKTYPVLVQAAYSNGDLIDVTNNLETVWASEDKEVAVVKEGKIIGQAVGTTQVSVKYDNLPSVDLDVKVTEEAGPVNLFSLDITNNFLRMMPGDVAESAILPAEYRDHKSIYTTIEVQHDGTWESDNTDVATVDADGNITAVGEGEAYIYFRYYIMVQPIYVKVGPPVSLGTTAIGGDELALHPHDTFGMDLYAMYDRREITDITGEAEWTTSDPSVATVTDNGLIIAHALGTTKITASYMELELEINVTVKVESDETATVALVATPSYSIQKVGEELPLQIEAVFRNGSSKDVTADVSWRMSNPLLANVTEQNKLQTNLEGAAVVMAEYGYMHVIIPVIVQANESEIPTEPTEPTEPVEPVEPVETPEPVQTPGPIEELGSIVTPAPTVTPTPTAPVPTATPIGLPKLIGAVDSVTLAAQVKQALESTKEVSFLDIVRSSWSASAIEYAGRIGFVKGYADGSFHPKAQVTRAEFSVMLARAFGLNVKGDAAFKDVTATSWAADSISALQAAGIIKGYNDGTFRPNQMISRAEIATILSRVILLDKPNTISKFTDIKGNWAADDINALSAVGIVTGKSETSFAPNSNASREEAVVLILRTLRTALDLDLKV